MPLSAEGSNIEPRPFAEFLLAEKLQIALSLVSVACQAEAAQIHTGKVQLHRHTCSVAVQLKLSIKGCGIGGLLHTVCLPQAFGSIDSHQLRRIVQRQMMRRAPPEHGQLVILNFLCRVHKMQPSQTVAEALMREAVFTCRPSRVLSRRSLHQQTESRPENILPYEKVPRRIRAIFLVVGVEEFSQMCRKRF